MEINKVVKPFIRRGANTFGNIVYIYIKFALRCCRLLENNRHYH